jgi:hypothetical protein
MRGHRKTASHRSLTLSHGTSFASPAGEWASAVVVKPRTDSSPRSFSFTVSLERDFLRPPAAQAKHALLIPIPITPIKA